MFAKPVRNPDFRPQSVSKDYTRKFTFSPNKIGSHQSQDKLGGISTRHRLLSAFTAARKSSNQRKPADSLYL
jgi:hypothetical protein